MILGTLFERGLDPDKRAQFGAHYTNRDKIPAEFLTHVSPLGWGTHQLDRRNTAGQVAPEGPEETVTMKPMSARIRIRCPRTLASRVAASSM